MSYDGGVTWDEVPDFGAARLTVPGAVVRVHELARDLGWRVAISFADGPPITIALRFARDGARAYAVWNLEDGKCRYKGGAANRIPGGNLRTLASCKAYLEEPA